MSVGSYVAGPPKSIGNFTMMGSEVLIDQGAFYASKDFYDPVEQRRINWGWAKIAYGEWNTGNPWDSSAHTLPREMTWHAELQQLVFSPLPEQTQLRGDVLGQLKMQELPSKQSVSLGLPAHTGNQSELLVTFARPSHPVTLRVQVGDPKTQVEFTVAYEPGKASVEVGCPSLRLQDTLRLSPSDQTITVRVFVDNVMAEVYWQNGRVVMTLPLLFSTGGCSMAVQADQPGVTLKSATAWEVKSVWVSVDQVLRTPRRDAGDVDLMVERIHAQQTL